MSELEKGSARAKEYAAATGQNSEDILFGIGSDRVNSIAEHNASGEPMVFGCLRTTKPASIPNCHRMTCDGCGHEVWMSPATKTVFDKIDKKVITCIECMTASLTKGNK